MNVKPYDMQHDVIIACDFKSAEDTFKFLDLFRGEARKPFLKIGMELFYAEGPEIVREIKRRGHKIFLDLKLHDIPNTVKKAMAVLSRLDVDMCNVHAAGTIEMMKYALEGLTREDGTRPLLIAVTQLTSTSEERMQQELLIASSIGDTIVKYAQNTKAAGLDGVVCSPLEAGMVHQACGKEFLTITPGVRFADGDVADQVRVTTPARAREIGSDFIVVGRPITAAADPVAAYRRAGCRRDRDDRGVGTARAGRHVRLLLRADILCRRREGARRRGLSRGGGEDFTLGTGITLRSGDPIRGSDSYEPAR